MPVFKCKMCGGDLQIGEKDTIAQCSYCGTQQTLPKDSDEVTANLFNRANNLRLKSEFDKALEVYEKILETDNSNAEAHWGVVLCKYGVEYVEDPKTRKMIPTCHRTQYESVLTDADYLTALANSDSSAGAVYEREAKQIAELQKDILAVVNREKPFDVFICYKETDASGARTRDSSLANDIYHHLTQEGYKVFYAAITLEDKLGQEYEPYIFAALHSAKVMLAVGTKPEHFNAPWVKNEWSRFLQIMKKEGGMTLIPCFAGMDAYDLPEEFAHLQALDMTKIGFIADLSRGIGKLVRSSQTGGAEKSTPTTSGQTIGNVDGLLERAFIFLEDGDWKQADEYCEKVLDLQPKNARAYIGKLMAEMQVREESTLASCPAPFAEKNNYQKALRFADEKAKKTLQGYNQTIVERLETERKEKIYTNLMAEKSTLQTEKDFIEVAEAFSALGGYKDSEAQAADCDRLAEEARILAEQQRLENERIAEERRLEAERLAELARIAAEKRRAKIKKILKIGIPSAAALIAFLIVLNTVIIPANKYSKAQRFVDEKKYSEAVSIFNELRDYKDSADKVNSTKSTQAEELLKAKKYAEAAALYRDLGGYKDSKQKLAPYKFLGLSAGDTLEFGNYEQDNDTTNGEEDVEWLVLEVKDDKVLLISKNCLDCQLYNDEFVDLTWATCTLRGWLNGEFFNLAFTAGEQSKVAQTQVENSDNSEYGTNGGAATTDRVFLLSIDEARRYFTSDSARAAKPTPYAAAQGAYENASGNAWWWLRSPSINDNLAGLVDSYGFAYDCRIDAPVDNYAVRPALWVNL